MKNILKILVVTILLVVLTVLLGASDTRIKGLGYLTNYYVRDPYNIWLFPSNIIGYKNMIFVDSKIDTTLWRGGIHFPIASTVTVGIYLSNDVEKIYYTDTEFKFDPFDRKDYFPNLDKDEVSHQFTIFSGFELTNMDIGLLISSFSSRFTYNYTNPADTTAEVYEDKLSSRLYSVGIDYKLNERSRMDASVFYYSGGFSHTHSVGLFGDTTKVKQPEGYNGYGINCRLFYVLNKNAVLVPFAGYFTGGVGYKNLIKTGNIYDTYVDKISSYRVGIGVDIIPRKKSLVTIAGGIESQSGSLEVTMFNGNPPVTGSISEKAFPFLSVGFETRLLKWLEARFSFYELLKSFTEKSPGVNSNLDEATITGSSYAARFGLSFHFRRIDIDTLIDTNTAADFIHYGPYLLGGKSYSGRGFFTNISITYKFKE